MSDAKAPNKGLSVVVPTYNETSNIRPLAERLFQTYEKAGINPVELLFMDDESVGTAATEKEAIVLFKVLSLQVSLLQAEGYAVRIHVRRKNEGRGLSSAVLLGFKMAKYPNLLCMDADLQHEPESVHDVAKPVMDGTAEFTVGSRYENTCT
jgi:dolichol-phosphate mannosyltransferase